MGTSFGETVCVLLETYSRCLSLLKGFRRTGKQTESQSRLGSSIRSDKAKIRRVYSARLSLRGGTFEKGDTTARSSIRRLVRKLAKTLEGLIRSPAGWLSQGDPVDYASLASLSSTSRRDAIRTMSDLSSRIKSGSSIVSRPSSSKSSRRGSKSPSGSRSSKKGSKKSKESEKKGRTKSEGKATAHKRADVPPPVVRAISEEKTPKANAATEKHHLKVQGAPGPGDKRASIMTFSSGSTKLGEIRHLREGDVARVTYPLRPFSSPEHRPKEQKRWLGLLRAR